MYFKFLPHSYTISSCLGNQVAKKKPSCVGLALLVFSQLVYCTTYKRSVASLLIKHHRSDIDKIYLYVKDPLESKYQLRINRRGRVGIENLKNAKAFTNN